VEEQHRRPGPLAPVGQPEAVDWAATPLLRIHRLSIGTRAEQEAEGPRLESSPAAGSASAVSSSPISPTFAKCRLREPFAEPLIALVMLSLGGLCPPLPGRS